MWSASGLITNYRFIRFCAVKDLRVLKARGLDARPTLLCKKRKYCCEIRMDESWMVWFTTYSQETRNIAKFYDEICGSKKGIFLMMMKNYTYF
jgi:hypothetical protein